MSAEENESRTDSPSLREPSKPDSIPEDERYFWTDSWQELERQADEDFQNGDYIEAENWEGILQLMCARLPQARARP